MIEPKDVTFEKLLEVGVGLRVHGNGFIQLDIGDGQRIHVWGSRAIPRQKVSTQIHNHRFDFESVTLAGEIENRIYSLTLGNEYREYYPSSIGGEDTILVCDKWSNPVDTLLLEAYTISVGQGYSMDYRSFHETMASELSMTLMTKTEVYKIYAPRVLVPVGSEPDNDFLRYEFSHTYLLDIVEEACNLIPEGAF